MSDDWFHIDEVWLEPGDPITARFLNNHSLHIYSLEERAVLLPPQQRNKPAAPEVQNEDAEAVAPTTFVETSRTVSTVQVFDQNQTNYAEVERVETINFTNAAGETLSLKFNNSEA